MKESENENEVLNEDENLKEEELKEDESKLDELKEYLLKDNVRPENQEISKIFKGDVLGDVTGGINAIATGLDDKAEKEFTDSYEIKYITGNASYPGSGYLFDEVYDPYHINIVSNTGTGIKAHKVINTDALKKYNQQLIERADDIDKIIDDHLPDDAVGHKLREFAKTVSSKMLRNVAKGYSEISLSYRTPLGISINSYSALVHIDFTTNKLYRNYKKYKNDFPVYDYLIETGNLMGLLTDYYVDKDKNEDGIVGKEAETEYRQKIYNEVVKIIPLYNKLMAQAENEEMNEKLRTDKMIDIKNDAFHMHPRAERGTLHIKCGLEAYKIGLENGWPLDDIPIIASFMSIAEKKRNDAEMKPCLTIEDYKKNINDKKPGYRSEKEEEYVNTMFTLIEKVKEKKLNSKDDRKKLLHEMDQMISDGISNGFLAKNVFLEDKIISQDIQANVKYYNQLNSQRYQREINIFKGKQPGIYPPATLDNSFKFNYMVQEMNSERTDRWFCSESKSHENFRKSVEELAKFREENKEPESGATREEKEKYYSEYLAKIDRVKLYSEKYIGKRMGASSTGGKTRLKGAADFSAFADEERKLIESRLRESENEKIDDLRVKMAVNKKDESLKKIEGFTEMPSKDDEKGRNRLSSLAADVLVGRFAAKNNSTAQKAFNELGFDVMKAEILKSKDFKNMMNSYMNDKKMDPKELCIQLTSDGALNRVNGLNKNINKTGVAVNKREADEIAREAADVRKEEEREKLAKARKEKEDAAKKRKIEMNKKKQAEKKQIKKK